jgi:predicted metal-dependent peptidase
MNAEEKLIRARIQIQNRNPFFAYLSLYLKFVEVNPKKGEEDILDGNDAGVDTKGNLYYKPDWIEGLTDEQVIGLILHEIMHLSFMHLLRRGNRHPVGWNICTDLAVNKIILDNNFQLPPNGVLPDGNEITLFGQTILNLDKKSAEILFDELKLKYDKDKKNGNGKGEGEGFDKHMESQETTPEERKKIEDEWLNRVEEAYVGAKMRGNVPAGIERLIGKLHENKVNWRAVLQR